MQPWISVEELSGHPEFAQEAIESASYILWALSGRKYGGVATVTETYECACRPFIGASYGNFEAVLIQGQVYNRFRECGCGVSHSRLRLRNRPALAVREMISGGKVVSPSNYSLINGSVIVSPRGTFTWDPCDVTVTYVFGAQPPVAGRRAARMLAEQLAKAWAGEDCELPENVTSVSRQGVNISLVDNKTLLDDFRTGLFEVDLFLKAVNPDKARKRSKVFSPDLPRGQRTLLRQGQPVAGPDDVNILPGQPVTWEINLADNAAELLNDDATWQPVGQISTWNGAVLFEFDASRFSIADGVLTVSLSGSDTSEINVSGAGVWDLYAQSVATPSTMIHVQTGNVYLSTISGSP